MSEEQRILDILKAENYYHDLRVLDDGTIVGTGKLMFTTALYIGLNTTGWERRYCYKNATDEDRALIQRNLDALKTGDDEPTGWIARRGG